MTTIRRAAVLLACAAFIAVSPALADDAKPGMVPDDVVLKLADYARGQLPMMKMADGKLVGPEQVIDRYAPYLPIEDLRRIVEAGKLSGNASACGMDWKNRTADPFIAGEKQSGRWNEKQLVYIQLLHDDTKQAIEAKLNQDSPCTDDRRAMLDNYLKASGH
jgi:hypothetical protein